MVEVDDDDERPPVVGLTFSPGTMKLAYPSAICTGTSRLVKSKGTNQPRTVAFPLPADAAQNICAAVDPAMADESDEYKRGLFFCRRLPRGTFVVAHAGGKPQVQKPVPATWSYQTYEGLWSVGTKDDVFNLCNSSLTDPTCSIVEYDDEVGIRWCILVTARAVEPGWRVTFGYKVRQWKVEEGKKGRYSYCKCRLPRMV
jgi:hypothetical protein